LPSILQLKNAQISSRIAQIRALHHAFFFAIFAFYYNNNNNTLFSEGSTKYLTDNIHVALNTIAHILPFFAFCIVQIAQIAHIEHQFLPIAPKSRLLSSNSKNIFLQILHSDSAETSLLT
jgi:hypothetical protein